MTSQPNVASGPLLELSRFQKMVLSASADPECKPGFFEQMTLRLALRMQPKLPLRRLHRAFDKLVARHDSLRLRFVEHAGEWKAVVMPGHELGLKREDLSHLTDAEQLSTIRERALVPISALADSLFEVTVFHCGDAEDVLLARANHAIMDGYSSALIIEELMKFALNIPSLGKAMGHAEFIQLNNKRLNERAEEKAAFWKAKILPVPEDPVIGRKAKGLPPISSQTVGPTVRINEVLTDVEATHVAETAKATGVSAFSLLHAAFSEAICELSGQTEAIIVSILGRNDTELSGFVGADIKPLLVKYEARPGHLEERARWIAQYIADATDHMPTTAFYPGSEISQAFEENSMPRNRFRVHIVDPTGRLSNSPFGKFFRHGMSEKVTIGFGSSEPIKLPASTETDFEIDFLIHQSKAGYNASMVADAAAYSLAALDEFRASIKRHLGFA